MFEKEILEKLKEIHASGRSYDEISKLTGVSRTTVAEILAGKRHIKNPSISMLLKVFPRAVIHLDGVNNNANADHGGIATSITGGNNNFFTPKGKDVLPVLIDAVMTSDLEADVKVKVYNIIKESVWK